MRKQKWGEREKEHTQKTRIRTWEMATRERDNIFMGSTNKSDQRSISFQSESDQSNEIYKFLEMKALISEPLP